MTPDDFTLTDDLLADAFGENGMARFLLGGGDIRSRLVRLNRTIVRQKDNSVMLAEVDGAPAGALVQGEWPRCEPSGMAGLRFAMDALLAARHRIILAAGLSRDASKSHPNWPHRHLTVLGVRRRFQGKGVGSKLLEKFCSDADTAGASCYLETDSEEAKRLYERFGFRETNRTTRNGLTFVYMWRQTLARPNAPAD